MTRDRGHKVTAAQIARNFSEFREKALTQPVFISSYGRTTHVLVSLEEYETQRTESALDSETYLEIAADLGEWTTGGLLICDNESTIRYINRIACGVLNVEKANAVGRTLEAAIPGYSGSLLETQARRTIRSDYPASADIPSPGRENSWLRFWSNPWRGWNLLSFRDITDHVESHRLADVKEAILQGMSVHGEIGYARLSIRGTIERVDQPLCDAIGLPESRMTGASLLDYVTSKKRVGFRDALETVLGQGTPVSTSTVFLDNDAKELPMRCGMVPLKGAFGLEGAVALFTPENGAASQPA